MKRTRTQKQKAEKDSECNGKCAVSETQPEPKGTKKAKQQNDLTEKKTKKDSDVEMKESEHVMYINSIQEYLKDFKEQPKYFKKPLGESNNFIRKLMKLFKLTVLSPLELYYKVKYDFHHNHSRDEDKCSICQFTFYDDLGKDLSELSFDEVKDLQDKVDNNVVLLDGCNDHFFHAECLVNMMGNKDYIKCPNCSKISGIMTGDQPPGIFQAMLIDNKCDGYKENTIQLYYEFPDGNGYTGTTRHGYIPNTREGKEILGLFKIAFDRKLMYIIGTSVTTGQSNTVIWNGIHHKTNLDGGAQFFGYPDNTYFNRVKQELAAKGVIATEIQEDLIEVANKLLEDTKNEISKANKKGKKKK